MVPRDKPGGLKRWWMTFSASAIRSQPAANGSKIVYRGRLNNASVNSHDNTVECTLYFHKLEICGNRAAPEEAFTGAQNDRKTHRRSSSTRL
jgi:hypothetical protein